MNHHDHLPDFSTIHIAEIQTELQHRLHQNRTKLNKLLQQSQFTWNNLMQPLEELQENLHHFWSIVTHMNAVINSDELRAVYNECLPSLSEYYTELSHNKDLYQAICSIKEGNEYPSLDKAQRKVIDNELRNFKLAGVALEPEQKKQFAGLVAELTQLASKFEENLLDATNQWQKHILDEKALHGIPSHALAYAKQRAKANNQDGWLFTLEMPSYIAVITHAESRDFRQEIYTAYTTRASDQAHQPAWDNSEILYQILCKRRELSHLLGFPHFAEQCLATRMVKTPTQVLDFLYQLADATVPKAKKEYAELADFARRELNIEQLAAWDIAYCSEKLRQHRYAISEEALRPYFAEPNVVNGLFTVVKKLFHIDIRPVENIRTWHNDARCYAVYDKNNKLCSYFYFDLYARPNKRGGAWMDDCRIRRKKADGGIQLPVAFVTCNFSQPSENQPALFSHDEVVTLFHEFGHALQHMLTTIDYGPVSGINGIPWDAVELASQFLENWAWQQESLKLFAKHFETNEILPEDLFKKLNRARNFQSAMQMVRQLEFALFDFRLHMEFDPKQRSQVQTILDEVRKSVSVVPAPKFNRFQHGFSHIFAGGYAAGYYSYKWAEVMASDAFSLFLEKGIFDSHSADKFLHYILQPGGSEDPDILFKKYRGHEPQIDALLQQSGITD